MRKRIGLVLAGFVTLIAAATLFEYLFARDLGIDQALLREGVKSYATTYAGRMAPTTATAFLSLGFALMTIDWETRRGGRPSQWLILWAGLISLLAIIGYLFHAMALYKILLYTQIAVHTAIALFLMSTGIFLARPECGIACELTGRASGAAMGRRFLPWVFLIPILLGWIRLQGQLAGWYDLGLGLALATTANIALFTVLVWLNARKMNGEFGQRRRAEDKIRHLNTDLEQRVADRTETLREQAAVLVKQSEMLDQARVVMVARAAVIEDSLKEKEVLLQEVHHRVKNNLQIVISLLDLQCAQIEDPATLDLLHDSQGRIRSMALIHQTLYQSNDFGNVDVEAFLNSLVPTLMSSYLENPERIRLTIDAEGMLLPLNLAIPCGLLINELVSNSLKHAFPGDRRGKIDIDFVREAGDAVRLCVADDGVGIPEGFNVEESTSLGLQLVSVLSEQLHGKLVVHRANPTSFGLTFSSHEAPALAAIG